MLELELELELGQAHLLMVSSTPWWWRRLRPPAIWYTTRLINEVGGLRVTSGWRSLLENTRAHGARHSGHLLGWCTDLVGTPDAMARGRQLALSWGARQVLIHDAGSGLHLHCDWRGAKG